MIIKKPYAFLIKHFKLIHLLLSILMLYLVLKTNRIFTFFNDYVKNGYYTYLNNISTSYINLYMFISVILILLLTSFIYLLMRWKKKSRKLYFFILTFYFALFIGFLFYYNVFNTILNTTLDVRVIRAYRDISIIMHFTQYIFLIICIIRATGFNIKKFDFKRDLIDLDIAEEDQEEIEVTFTDNTYKVKRAFRKNIREFIYYLKENKFFFIIISATVLFVITLFIFFQRNVTNKTYTENEYFNVDGIIFRVENSYVTNIDLKGNSISNESIFLILNLSIQNTLSQRSKLNTSDLRIKINDKNYYPTFSRNEYFTDLGEGYYKNTLYAGEKYNYLLIYEIPNNENYKKAIFRVVNNISIKNGEIDAKYKDVELKSEEYFTNEESSSYSVGEIVSLESSTLKESNFVINSFEIKDDFTESFTYCTNTCSVFKKIIKPNILTGTSNAILKINMIYEPDESLFINKYIHTPSDFLDYFGSIKYTVNDVEKNSSFSVVKIDFETNNVYLEVSNEVKNAESLDLIVIIRNQKYVVNLK